MECSGAAERNQEMGEVAPLVRPCRKDLISGLMRLFPWVSSPEVSGGWQEKGSFQKENEGGLRTHVKVIIEVFSGKMKEVPVLENDVFYRFLEFLGSGAGSYLSGDRS